MHAACLLFALAAPLFQERPEGVLWRALEREGAAPLEYALVLPREDAPEGPAPLLLAFPPGAQDRGAVVAGLERYWAAPARERGWIVVSPVAAERAQFARGDLSAVRALVTHVLAEHAVEGRRVHVAGPSNGGRAAVRYALDDPGRAASLTVLPGSLAPDDAERAERLVDLPVRLHVGADDAEPWVAAARDLDARLRALGARDVVLHVAPGVGHVLPNATGPAALAALEPARARARSLAAVERVLDDFHLAASEPDGERYFGHFAPGAVFLGTASEERWSVAEFRAYAEPYFSQGRGWTYRATERHVGVQGEVAWFDERLHNEKYGECRGTGVLRRLDGRWRIAQYNLAFPVPNELAPDLVERIRALGK